MLSGKVADALAIRANVDKILTRVQAATKAIKVGPQVTRSSLLQERLWRRRLHYLAEALSAMVACFPVE